MQVKVIEVEVVGAMAFPFSVGRNARDSVSKPLFFLTTSYSLLRQLTVVFHQSTALSPYYPAEPLLIISRAGPSSCNLLFSGSYATQGGQSFDYFALFETSSAASSARRDTP